MANDKNISQIETNGVNPVPDGERYGKPADLFPIWFSWNISIFGITCGMYVFGLGLSVAQAMAAGVLGLPTTLLIDGEGNELGRIRGMAEWDGPTLKAQIRDIIRREKAKPPAAPEPSAPASAESDVPPPPDRTNDFSGWFK